MQARVYRPRGSFSVLAASAAGTTVVVRPGLALLVRTREIGTRQPHQHDR